MALTIIVYKCLEKSGLEKLMSSVSKMSIDYLLKGVRLVLSRLVNVKKTFFFPDFTAWKIGLIFQFTN